MVGEVAGDLVGLKGVELESQGDALVEGGERIRAEGFGAGWDDP